MSYILTLCLFTTFYPFHFILFFHFFLNFSNPLIHLILSLFFSIIFSTSLNINHLYYIKIRKVKPFYIIFPNHFQTIFFIQKNGMEWAKCPPGVNVASQIKLHAYYKIDHAIVKSSTIKIICLKTFI